jgi:hypothetical protein
MVLVEGITVKFQVPLGLSMVENWVLLAVFVVKNLVVLVP